MAERYTILTRLPEVLGRQILVEWLVLRDVVRLDTAYCIHAQRANFVALAYVENTPYSTATNKSAAKASDSIVSWSILKGARVDCVCLTKRLVEDVDHRSTFLSLNRLSIKSLIIHNNLSKLPYQEYHGVMLHITGNCPNIVELNYDLSRPFPSDEEEFSAARSLMYEGLTQAVANCTHLECVELRCLGEVPQSVACPTLKSLVVTGTGSVFNDLILVALGQNSPKLEHLHYSSGRLFGGGPSVTDAGVEALLLGCPLLRDTNIHLLTDLRPDLRVELARRADYEELKLSHWRRMTEEVLEGILRVSPSLRLLDCSDQEFVGDAILLACADYCPSLETINLSGCSGVTSDGLCAFLSQAGCRLKCMDISGTTCLWGDEVVRAVAEHCPMLERFHSPRNVSDAAIANLAEECPKLSVVELQFTAVSVTGITALAKHCPSLTTLQLDGCDRLTMQCVDIMLTTCPALTHVMLPDGLWHGAPPSAVQQLVLRGVQVTAFHRPIRVSPSALEPEMAVPSRSDERRHKATAAKNCCIS